MSSTSYTVDNSGNLSTSDGVKLGQYDSDSKTFTLASEKLASRKGRISRFMNRLHKPIEHWDVAEAPDMDREDRDEGDIPPRPRMDRLMGDKTPALVRWLERYKFSEFKERYGVLGRGTVPRYETDLDGETRLVGHEEVWIARRKTVLTERANIPSGEEDNLQAYGIDPV